MIAQLSPDIRGATEISDSISVQGVEDYLYLSTIHSFSGHPPAHQNGMMCGPVAGTIEI
jgi:hypothetical protein